MKTLQKNKFTMELVWHNCLTYKPEESFNRELYVTDGTTFHKVVYKKDIGFVGDGIFIDDAIAKDYWWADLLQTINNTRGFADD